MILAALRANGVSKRYKENELTRDHTERMLKGMGAKRLENDSEGFIQYSSFNRTLKTT